MIKEFSCVGFRADLPFQRESPLLRVSLLFSGPTQDPGPVDSGRRGGVEVRFIVLAAYCVVRSCFPEAEKGGL